MCNKQVFAKFYIKSFIVSNIHVKMAQILFKNYKLSWSSLLNQLFEIPYKNINGIRFYTNTNKSEKEAEVDFESSTYKDTSSQYGIGKKYAVAKLQELFNLRLFPASEVATKFKKLQLVTGKTMSDNYHLLKEHGIGDAIILEYPDVLAQKNIKEKIDILKNLPFAIVDTVPLLNLDFIKCTVFVIRQGNESINISGGRIRYLSKLLDLSIIQTCAVLVRRQFLLNIDLTKLETNVKLLTEFGIELDEIKRDYWVLQYNSDVIKHRLGLAKELKVEKIKTWMVRAQTEIFNTYIQRRSDNKLILGNNSLVEYLSERLECTAEQSKLILTKHPALASKSMRRLKEIIDFLYSDGFTPTHIVRSPKILLHSVETTRKRLRELESQGMKVDSLHILTKSQRQYMHYYKNLVKSNKSKIKDET